MPPKKGGNRQRKTKKATDESDGILPTREEGQTYAVVSKMLGNRRLLARCEDEKERLCMIPGKFKGKKSYWVCNGYLLLVNIRDFQDAKGDVVYIYNSNEYKRLKRMGELEKLMTEEQEEDEKGIVFYEDDHAAEEASALNVNEILEDSDESVDLEDL